MIGYADSEAAQMLREPEAISRSCFSHFTRAFEAACGSRCSNINAIQSVKHGIHAE